MLRTGKSPFPHEIQLRVAKNLCIQERIFADVLCEANTPEVVTMHGVVYTTRGQLDPSRANTGPARTFYVDGR